MHVVTQMGVSALLPFVALASCESVEEPTTLLTLEVNTGPQFVEGDWSVRLPVPINTDIGRSIAIELADIHADLQYDHKHHRLIMSGSGNLGSKIGLGHPGKAYAGQYVWSGATQVGDTWRVPIELIGEDATTLTVSFSVEGSDFDDHCIESPTSVDADLRVGLNWATVTGPEISCE